jgi:hypothetical protein
MRQEERERAYVAGPVERVDACDGIILGGSRQARRKKRREARCAFWLDFCRVCELGGERRRKSVYSSVDEMG